MFQDDRRYPMIAPNGIVVSSVNLTETPLAASGSWTGVTERVTDFAEIDVNIFGAPSVAPGTLYFEFSPNDTDWDVSVALPVTALQGVAPVPLRVVLPFFRARYVNGGTIQTVFRLTTVFHVHSAKQLTRFPQQSFVGGIEPVEVFSMIGTTGQGKDLKFVPIDQAIAGTTEIVPADASRRIKVPNYIIVLTASGTAKFTDGTQDLSGVFDVGKDVPIVFPGQVDSHAFQTGAINRPINIVTVGSPARGHLSYFLE